MTQPERLITHYTVTLGEMTREGVTLAEITERDEAGGEKVHRLQVPAGLPGERVTIAVEAPAAPHRRRRSRRWKPRSPRVEITEIHHASPLRTEAPCPVFGTCGGCQFQHMQYPAQLEWKRSIVRQLLHDIGGFDDPPLLEIVPCDDPWHYRNHMRFSVNRSGQLGLTARGTQRVLPLTSCPIAHERINRALGVLSQVSNARPQVVIRAASGQVLIQPQPASEVAQQLTAAGLDLHSDTMEEVVAGETFRIRPSSFFQTNTAQAEKMVRMVLDGLLKDMASDDLAPAPRASAPRAPAPRASAPRAPAPRASAPRASAPRASAPRASADRATADRATARVAPTFPEPEEVSGERGGTVADAYCGVGARATARVAPTFPEPEEVSGECGGTVADAYCGVGARATARVAPTFPGRGGTYADAYCGVGTFALLLARHVGKVIAIEESASAIKDAQWNLRNVDNVELLQGKTEDLLPTVAGQLDGLVLDPPRAGCQQVVLDALVQHPVARIVYVSCDPGTLARDLNILCHLHPTYCLRSVQPLDMFPQTVHIECVAVLEYHAV